LMSSGTLYPGHVGDDAGAAVGAAVVGTAVGVAVVGTAVGTAEVGAAELDAAVGAVVVGAVVGACVHTPHVRGHACLTNVLHPRRETYV
jgi:subtilisin family serine protease